MDHELQIKIDKLNESIKRLKASKKFIPVPYRSQLGAISKIKLDMLDLFVKSNDVLKSFKDIKKTCEEQNTVIQTEAQLLAKLGGVCLNDAVKMCREVPCAR